MFWEFVSFLALRVNIYAGSVLEYFIVVVQTFPAHNLDILWSKRLIFYKVRPKAFAKMVIDTVNHFLIYIWHRVTFIMFKYCERVVLIFEISYWEMMSWWLTCHSVTNNSLRQQSNNIELSPKQGLKWARCNCLTLCCLSLYVEIIPIIHP